MDKSSVKWLNSLVNKIDTITPPSVGIDGLSLVSRVERDLTETRNEAYINIHTYTRLT